MAVSLVGSAEQVQAAMKCSASDFREYLEGSKEPPWTQIDSLISLIIHEQGLIIAKNRENLAKRRREEK